MFDESEAIFTDLKHWKFYEDTQVVIFAVRSLELASGLSGIFGNDSIASIATKIINWMNGIFFNYLK